MSNPIGEKILNTMMPEARKNARYEVDTKPSTPVIYVRFGLASFIDLGKIVDLFSIREGFSYRGEVGDEPDIPAIVIKGAIDGTRIEVVLVLKDDESDVSEDAIMNPPDRRTIHLQGSTEGTRPKIQGSVNPSEPPVEPA